MKRGGGNELTYIISKYGQDVLQHFNNKQCHCFTPETGNMYTHGLTDTSGNKLIMIWQD